MNPLPGWFSAGIRRHAWRNFAGDPGNPLRKEQFKREGEKELAWRETEPREIIYFKVYKSQIPGIEQAIETISRATEVIARGAGPRICFLRSLSCQAR